MTTASATGLVTAEELLAMPRDGKRYELIRGELVERMPTGDPHANVVKWTTFVLTEYEIETGYGEVKTGEPGYRLEFAPDTVRAPDVAWVAPGRIPPGTQGYPQLAPDLVVEVQSPRQNLRGKALMWLHYGCRRFGWRRLRRSVLPAIARALSRLRCMRMMFWMAGICCRGFGFRCGGCFGGIVVKYLWGSKRRSKSDAYF